MQGGFNWKFCEPVQNSPLSTPVKLSSEWRYDYDNLSAGEFRVENSMAIASIGYLLEEKADVLRVTNRVASVK